MNASLQAELQGDMQDAYAHEGYASFCQVGVGNRTFTHEVLLFTLSIHVFKMYLFLHFVSLSLSQPLDVF